MENKFTRIVTFAPAWDRRSDDPAKNYGIHGVELRMVLKGPQGAVQFVLYTNWMLPKVQQELDRKADPLARRMLSRPIPADLGYHWHKPRYEGHEAMPCDYTPTGRCYYDGSGMNAERIYETLLKGGSENVWHALEDYYHSLEEEA